ncbi:hypothetical protein RUM44_002798 [Polyplax serrata]|uniref:DNA endonuclease RBBP8 n=1 Tax=Polyplax serrata TaxID=468196 RepID=A0ABR1AGA7_POLSC
MDINNVTMFNEVNNMQRKISSLFKEIWTEKNQYKTLSEDLKHQLDSLLKDVNDLKKENWHLLQLNKQLKSAILRCFNIFKGDITRKTSNSDFNSAYEWLRSSGILDDFSIENDTKQEEYIPVRRFNCLDDDSRTREYDNVIHSDITEKFLECVDANLRMNNWAPGRNKTLQLSDSVDSTAEQSGASTSKTSTVRVRSMSPVFRSLTQKELNTFNIKGNDEKNSGRKVSPDKFLICSSDVITSPLKRISNFNGDISPKRCKKLKAERSPTSHIRKSNWKETANSDPGTKKFTQTRLNVNIFKKRTSGNLTSSSKSENQQDCTTDDWKSSADVDDDVIWESPSVVKYKEELVEIKEECTENFGNVDALNRGAVDLDETCLPAEVCKSNSYQMEIDTKLVSPSQLTQATKSPEYNSVPFVYKQETPKKTSERVKLPHQMCLECNRYYKDMFGMEANNDNFRKILNKCSRHRNIVSPDAEETPPGYWKPYITATFASPGKGDG